MPASVDWHYHRANCETCSKAKAFLDEHGIASREVVLARQVAIEPTTAFAMLDKVQHLAVVRGSKVYEFERPQFAEQDEQIESMIIGRSGSLRAPTIRVGTTMIVGYEKNLYSRVLGVDR